MRAKEGSMARVHGLLPALSGNEKIWLFQSDPQRYTIIGALREMATGDVSTWNVREHRDELRGGDLILLWQMGGNAGLYAIGTVVQEPYLADAFENGAGQEWWVKWRLDASLDPPVPQAEFLQDPVLSQMELFKNPEGTNFPVTPDEWAAVRGLMEAEPAFEPVVGEPGLEV
jgi:hypothetical protein